MAKRKKDVTVELNYRLSMAKVWSDLECSDFDAIGGVAGYEQATNEKGVFYVWIDPRYDREEVLESIKTLASAKSKTLRDLATTAESDR